MKVRVEIVTLGKQAEGVGKIELMGKAEGSIYDNQCFIKIPWAKMAGLQIGDQYELVAVEKP